MSHQTTDNQKGPAFLHRHVNAKLLSVGPTLGNKLLGLVLLLRMTNDEFNFSQKYMAITEF